MSPEWPSQYAQKRRHSLAETRQMRAGRAEADSWQWWNQVRGLCGHHTKLGILLEVPENLPPHEEIQRWLGEPVRALVLSCTVFQTNKRGYPTLSKPHQDLLLLFFCQGVQV